MTDAVEPSPPRSPARRRRRRRIVLLALLLFGVWLTRWVYLHITLRPTPRPEHWIEQIERLDPPPPGAYSYDQAIRILEDAVQQMVDLDITYASPWRRRELLRADELRAWGGAFASEDFSKARAMLVTLGKRHWQLERASCETPPLIESSTFRPTWTNARVLLDHAQWSWAEDGQVDVVLEDWRTVARLARDTGRSRRRTDRRLEHVLYDRLAFAMTEWATEAMRQHALECGALGRLAGQEACLCPLIHARAWALEIERIMGPELPANEYCAGERPALMAMLEYNYVREHGDWLDVSEAVRWSTVVHQSIPPMQAPIPNRAWNLLSPAFHDFAEAVEVVDTMLAYPEDAVDLPAAKAISDAQGDAAALGALQGFPEYFVLGSGDVMVLLYGVRCRIGAALTCLAIRDFHLSRGRFPDELGELVPEFLPRLPIDYGDRNRLRYRREGDGFILYSVGWNGVDDGGVPRDPTAVFNEINPDMVFVTYP
ncbi:MAG: hypothetical protein JXB13_13450 [Phycisphaerae bacterium]|nr:hypothetical protein [Phycisphaerae bacterium]